MTPEIYTDVFEPEYFFEELVKSGHTSPELHVALPTGDFVWNGLTGQSIGIERKEVSDMLSSYANGRLTDQLSRLVAQYSMPILIIEGFLGMNPDGSVKLLGPKGGFHTRAFRFVVIQEMLLEAQMAGIMVLWTTSKFSTLQMIRGLYAFSQKTEHSLLNKRTRPFQLGTRVDEQTFLVMGLPGFGEKTARTLLGEFGTPFGVFGALLMDASRVLAIDGIGQAKLQRAQKVLTGSPAENKDEKTN